MEYNISINEKNETSAWINLTEIKINPDIEKNELFEYKVRTRKEIMDYLKETLESSPNHPDKEAIIDNLEYLKKLIDVFIFVNVGTNDYVASSDNKKVFDELCIKLLNLNDNINKNKVIKQKNKKNKTSSPQQ